MSRLSRLNPHFEPAFDGFKLATELIQKLNQALPVLEAYLFGSCVEEKNTENSDIDLVVVIPDSRIAAEYYSVVNTPFFSGVAVDWIFITKQNFIRDRAVGGVSRVAYLTGKRIPIDDPTK